MAPVPVSDPVPDDGMAHLRHTPRARARTRAPVELTMDVLHPERVSAVIVHWRIDNAAWAEAEALRAEGRWTATLPAPSLEARHLDYFITLRTPSGATVAAFARADAPHTTVIRPEDDDVAEAMELSRNARRRLEFNLEGEYVNFGSRPNPNGDVCGAAAGARCDDGWYALRGAVRYRYYRTVRSVTVRAERLAGQGTVRDRFTGAFTSREVGLIAGTVEIELRAHDLFSFSLGAILGADQVSVQGGVLGRLEIGVDRPTRGVLSAQHITGFGTLVSAWMRFVPVVSVPMGIGIEVTDQPSAQRYGARLLFDLGLRLSQNVSLALRGGYGARNLEASGFTVGLGLGLTL